MTHVLSHLQSTCFPRRQRDLGTVRNPWERVSEIQSIKERDLGTLRNLGSCAKVLTCCQLPSSCGDCILGLTKLLHGVSNMIAYRHEALPWKLSSKGYMHVNACRNEQLGSDR